MLTIGQMLQYSYLDTLKESACYKNKDHLKCVNILYATHPKPSFFMRMAKKALMTKKVITSKKKKQ